MRSTLLICTETVDARALSAKTRRSRCWKRLASGHSSTVYWRSRPHEDPTAARRYRGTSAHYGHSLSQLPLDPGAPRRGDRLLPLPALRSVLRSVVAARTPIPETIPREQQQLGSHGDSARSSDRGSWCIFARGSAIAPESPPRCVGNHRDWGCSSADLLRLTPRPNMLELAVDLCFLYHSARIAAGGSAKSFLIGCNAQFDSLARCQSPSDHDIGFIELKGP